MTSNLTEKDVKKRARISSSAAAGAKKPKKNYVPPSIFSDPTANFGQGMISKHTGRSYEKRGRRYGSKVNEDGTIEQPAGSMRPTPMKLSSSVNLVSPGDFVQNMCAYSVKDGEILALRQEILNATSAKNAVEAELTACTRDCEKDRNAFLLHEDRLFSEQKSRKNFIKTSYIDGYESNTSYPQ
jgi:hypothetical protein